MYSLIVLVFSTLMLSEIVKCQLQQDVCKYKTGERFYDFTPLGNASLDYVLQNERTNESIRFQLCHELKEECNGGAGYAACLMTNTNTSIGIGRFPPNIYYDDGGIIFKFIGDPCPTADRKYNLTVVMHCDYAEKDQPLALFPYQQGSCDFVILWRTKRACHPQLPKTVDCTINNTKGDLVDLTELKKVNENYEIAINNTSSIILNVCHPVIPGYGAVCLESAGACFRNESSSNVKYANIGDVSGPKLENGTITLHYATGQICGKDADHSETTISFICDYKANNSHPVLNHTDGCNYKLLWKTVAACSKKDIYTYRSKTAEPCRIEDPSTKIVYDLETLKNQDYIVKGFEGIEYKFSICRPLFNAKCSPAAGVCSSENLQTEGLANSNLTWSPRGPYLTYTNGSLCENGKRRNTTIVFICAAQPMGPMISVEDPCELQITFPTPLVCIRRSTLPNQKIGGNSTAPKNDSVVDVTPTITTTTQAAAAMNGTSGTTAAPSPSITPKTNIPPTNSSGKNESIVIDKSKSSESSAGPAGEMAKSSDDDGKTSSHGGTIALVVILVIISLFGGVYLANPRRRELVFSYCTASCLRRSRTRMQYSEEL